ncbi:MAG: ATP-binding cassette domain-containing protein [Arhodomonas sp.]|nr:ATP-binding cassette domain-containing protein [Arhodomonas sp.]
MRWPLPSGRWGGGTDHEPTRQCIAPDRWWGSHTATGGQVLLGDVSLRIEGRGNTVLLGPNGAGKSLLMRVCHGLLEPSRGQVRYAGVPPARGHRRHLAMVFQQPVLLRRSALANRNHMPCRPAAVSRADRQRKARAREARTGVPSSTTSPERPARVLSGR